MSIYSAPKVYLLFMKKFFAKLPLFFLITIFLLAVSSSSFSDTVTLKDGKKFKGLVVDEFSDRIVLSTKDGEKTFLKEEVKGVYFDDEIKAVMQTARNQFKRGQYVEAYYTYKRALELDPTSKEALERFTYLETFLNKKLKHDFKKSIIKNKIIHENAEGVILADEIKERLGVNFSFDGEHVRIEEILDNCTKDNKELLRPGDTIVSIWSEQTAYMDVDDIAEILSIPGEIKMRIERGLNPKLRDKKGVLSEFLYNYENSIGAVLKIEKEGLTVGEVEKNGPFYSAGINTGDFICRINGEDTRYMPFKTVLGILKSNQGKYIETIIRRDIVLWCKDKGI